jgi:hypothetical protein
VRTEREDFLGVGILISADFLQHEDFETLIQAVGNNQRLWKAWIVLASGGAMAETEAATWT